MKRIELEKSAIDFAFANYKEQNQLALSKATNAAFEAAGYDGADYQYWTSRVGNYMNIFQRLADSLVPSAMLAAQKQPQAQPVRPQAS